MKNQEVNDFGKEYLFVEYSDGYLNPTRILSNLGIQDAIRIYCEQKDIPLSDTEKEVEIEYSASSHEASIESLREQGGSLFIFDLDSIDLTVIKKVYNELYILSDGVAQKRR